MCDSPNIDLEENTNKIIDENSTYETPTSTTQKQNANEFDFPAPAKTFVNNNNNKTMTVDQEMKYTYPALMTNPFERENWTIQTDHCYARPWNWRPEANFLRPTKTLFIPKVVPTKRRQLHPLAPQHDYDDVIDIETVSDEPNPVYDVNKAKNMMEDCDKIAALARGDKNNDDWEETISKINWTPTQNRLFKSVVNILNNFQIARLAETGVHNEPILRRVIIDKSVQRIRRLLASISWDVKLTQWLHQLLIDHLSVDYLSAYLEILRTLKTKLPSFVDKLIYQSSSSNRLGALSNENLFNLIKRQWDPVAASLVQDKPKKLPGNTVIVVVPSSPIMSKRMHKWIAILSNLAPVMTVSANLGSSGHRMTLMTCLDHMFASTRVKIQEIRSKHPDRNIVLVGFNAGATLALQLAQVEPVLCVISLGFSLLTAEGKRGEADDNILELYYPTLFVIGQCSSTSLQEDLEDLRERMRIETGLIVVGSADENLRISKRKRKAEGITQSIVDRCIVDEIGEFISGIILSPFPPQVRRQSPVHIPSDNKKNKVERKRYNSNTSSLDSEPPSPTPRITRPGSNNSSPNFGRPPGSKSKSRLEAKWAAQIAQGSPFIPSPSASPPPTTYISNTPDNSSNDSSLTDKSSTPIPKTNDLPVKKIKTLKPVVPIDKSTSNLRQTTPSSSPVKNIQLPVAGAAKMQAYGLNRSVMTSGPISTLLQGGIKTLPPTQPKSNASGIKVLENVQLNNTSKIISNAGRTVDLSKITVINSMNTGGSKVGVNTLSNVVLLPDGKFKTVAGNTIKNTTSSPIIMPVSSPCNKNMTHSQSSYSSANKLITSKRQLIGNKPPRPVKKVPYIPTTSALPPPTNLTSEDIMDLPIIFADDNQMIDTSLVADGTPTTQSATPTTPKIITTPGSKFVLVNKQSNPGNFIITPSIRKQQAPIAGRQQPRFTKIILSKKSPSEECKTKLSHIPSDITVKKVVNPNSSSTNMDLSGTGMENIDLEAELVATAVPKPNFASSDIKNITIITKKGVENLTSGLAEELRKRVVPPIDYTEDESDPDYIPPKNMKLDM